MWALSAFPPSALASCLALLTCVDFLVLWIPAGFSQCEPLVGGQRWQQGEIGCLSFCRLWMGDGRRSPQGSSPAILSWSWSFPSKICKQLPRNSAACFGSPWCASPLTHWLPLLIPMPLCILSFLYSKYLYWNIISPWCCVSFSCTMKWISHMHTYIPFLLGLPPTAPPPTPSIYVITEHRAEHLCFIAS